MDALLNRARRAFERRMSETCVIRSANPNAPDPDEPYTDSAPTPCSYVPASAETRRPGEVLTVAGVELTTRAHVELPAAQFGRVHADDRILLTDSGDPVLAAHIANQRLMRRPMQFAVDGEPDVPSTRLIANVRSV